ncbi:MAG: rhomboid family intramembrane serine protease [Prevotellaceae bacterium]|jgi:membrane associated rhomboid family serine protease|nr:rhomboid family intramembrane serine protease [Prevotellaceae bacterium]
MSIIHDIQRQFKQGSIVIQLIYVNVGVFLVTLLLRALFLLFNRELGGFFTLFELPASFPRLLSQPWSIVSYMFMHADLLHILFNMLWLYWFGDLFLRVHSIKHLRGLYFLGGIMGGLCYMVSFNLFPYFHPLVASSLLLGASASILAIVVAAAFRMPNTPINLFLFGTVRLKYLALFVVLFDVLLMTSDNAGGHIAHLGGALTGWWFGAALNKGHDITAWLNRIIDFLFGLFDKRTWIRQRKPKVKVYKTGREQDYEYNAHKKQESEEIDRILEKIKKSGYQNLTTAEKKRLFDASKR